MIPDVAGALQKSETHSPRPQHLSQIGSVDMAVVAEIHRAAVAWPPIAQHEGKVERPHRAITVKIRRAGLRLAVAGAVEQDRDVVGTLMDGRGQVQVAIGVEVSER